MADKSIEEKVKVNDFLDLYKAPVNSWVEINKMNEFKIFSLVQKIVLIKNLPHSYDRNPEVPLYGRSKKGGKNKVSIIYIFNLRLYLEIVNYQKFHLKSHSCEWLLDAVSKLTARLC